MATTRAVVRSARFAATWRRLNWTGHAGRPSAEEATCDRRLGRITLPLAAACPPAPWHSHKTGEKFCVTLRIRTQCTPSLISCYAVGSCQNAPKFTSYFTDFLGKAPHPHTAFRHPSLVIPTMKPLAYWRSEAHWNIATSIDSFMTPIIHAYTPCANSVNFRPVTPEIRRIEIVTFGTGCQKLVYISPNIKESWTDLHQIFRFGRHVSGND